MKISQEPKAHEVNVATAEDPYPWLDKDDPRRNMTEEEIIREKIPLQNSNLNDAEKERLIEMIMENKEALRRLDSFDCRKLAMYMLSNGKKILLLFCELFLQFHNNLHLGCNAGDFYKYSMTFI